jgi:anti-anti-sigma regulatory factor
MVLFFLLIHALISKGGNTMTAQFDQSGKAGVLTLDGELTLEHADEIRSSLIKAIINADQVTLNFEKATRADLACLQLLCSAHRTSTRLNKRMTFSGHRPEVLSRAAIDAGFARCTGCDLDRQKSCLWAGNCA